MRQVQVPLDSQVINAFYDFPTVIDCEQGSGGFKTLTVQGSKWMNKDSRVVNKIKLKPIAKVWVKFLKSRLISIAHMTIISQDRLILLYATVKGFSH